MEETAWVDPPASDLHVQRVYFERYEGDQCVAMYAPMIFTNDDGLIYIVVGGRALFRECPSILYTGDEILDAMVPEDGNPDDDATRVRTAVRLYEDDARNGFALLPPTMRY